MARRDDRAAWTAWAQSKGLIEEIGKPLRKNKFGARKTGGYASKKEAARAGELKLMEQAGLIWDLQEQVRFELIAKQEGERSCAYICDFQYRMDGQLVIEDVKSKATKTRAYIIKRKLLKAKFGITIVEV